MNRGQWDRLGLKAHLVLLDATADGDAEGNVEKTGNLVWWVNVGHLEQWGFLDRRVLLVVLVKVELTERMDNRVHQELADRTV